MFKIFRHAMAIWEKQVGAVSEWKEGSVEGFEAIRGQKLDSRSFNLTLPCTNTFIYVY